MRILLALASLALASVCLGCGDDDDGGTNSGTSFTASVSGSKAQSAGNAYVIWTVSSGSPDYTYLLGSGTSSGGKASVSLSVSKDAASVATLPDEALNIISDGSLKLGVGLIALVDSSAASLPQGKLTKDQIRGVEKQALGLSARHALIYRDGSRGPDVTGVAWIDKFPQGLSCGRCVTTPGNPDGTSNGFDTFEPVDCHSLEVQTADDLDSLDVCNWT